jgi:DNA-binding NarL/FixJ family response regulator
MAAEQQPQVIVLDHLLPDATSEALLPQLRAAAAGARVLLISGLPADDLAEAARAAGADGYVAKWSTAEAMRSAVSALMV